MVLVALVILIVAGVLVYWQQPKNSENPSQPVNQSQAPTSDWQTYRNEQYGFEMQYPADWNVESEKQSNTGAEMITIYKEFSGPNISIFPKGEFDSGSGPEPGSQILTTSLAEKKAVKIDSNGQVYYYFIEATPNWITCSETSLTNCNRMVISGKNRILDQILLSFKFIK